MCVSVCVYLVRLYIGVCIWYVCVTVLYGFVVNCSTESRAYIMLSAEGVEKDVKGDRGNNIVQPSILSDLIITTKNRKKTEKKPGHAD